MRYTNSTQGEGAKVEGYVNDGLAIYGLFDGYSEVALVFKGTDNFKLGTVWNYGARFFRGSGAEASLYHTVTSPKLAQSVLEGINPAFFNSESRFGGAFYMSEVPDTTLAELKFHDATGTHTLRYNFSKDSAKILDLTKSRVARRWGYNGGRISDFTKSIGLRAQEAGYNVIRYNSERGKGANLAIFDNFESLLQPQMVVPTPEFESTSPDLIYAKIFGYGG